MEDVIDLALHLDIGKGDVTSNALFSKAHKTKAVIIAKESGLLAGGEEAVYVFKQCRVKARLLKKDGEKIKKGDKVLSVTGSTRGVLEAERTALNILSRMSGIATLTSQLAKKGVVAARRKSPPANSLLDKKAVIVGGGIPHRLGLWDMTLIKDTHLDSISKNRGKAIKQAMKKAKKPVEIEVMNKEEALLAASLGAEFIMLDNFTATQAKTAINALRKKYPDVIIEISGGVNPKNLGSYMKAGPDFISLGMLTTAAKPLDFSMKIKA